MQPIYNQFPNLVLKEPLKLWRAHISSVASRALPTSNFRGLASPACLWFRPYLNIFCLSIWMMSKWWIIGCKASKFVFEFNHMLDGFNIIKLNHQLDRFSSIWIRTLSLIVYSVLDLQIQSFVYLSIWSFVWIHLHLSLHSIWSTLHRLLASHVQALCQSPVPSTPSISSARGSI